MKVSEVMIKDIYTVMPQDSIKKVVGILCTNRITGVPVVNENYELLGIISEKDILQAMYPKYDELYDASLSNIDFEELEGRYKDVTTMKTENLMVKNVITAAPDATILKVASLMISKNIRRIPIVDGKRLIGIISQGAIHQAIFRQELGI
jgi:CBS domain-containing protein